VSAPVLSNPEEIAMLGAEERAPVVSKSSGFANLGARTK
jgi:hypothetical protein